MGVIRMMKEPISKENTEIKKESYADKIIEEQHFCPICGKPTAKYYYEYYKEGGFDDSEIETENAWWWIDPDECEISISKHGCTFIIGNFFNEDELILFTKEEYEKINKNILSIFKIFEEFYDDYGNAFEIKTKDGDSKPSPYFCSKECVKNFIMKNLS